MSETLKNGGEKTAEGAGGNHLEVLTEMRDKFDANKAKERVEADKPKVSKDKKSTHLEVISKKPEKKAVEELTPKEASKEYLDLLMDLSSNFTSAEGKSSRAASYDKNGNIAGGNTYSGGEKRIVGQIYETATGKKFRDEERNVKIVSGVGKKWDDKYVDRELAIGMADDIISAESDWRAVGESTNIEAEQQEKATIEREKAEAKAKLDKLEHGVFSKLKKALFKSFRGKEYDRLYNTANRKVQTSAEARTTVANARLQEALRQAYSEDYGYGHHDLNYNHTYTATGRAEAARMDDEFNEQFFDKTRQEKIDRAIELRRKLEADGLIAKRSYAEKQRDISLVRKYESK